MVFMRPVDEGSSCYRCLYIEDLVVGETYTANGVIALLLGIIGNIQANEALKLTMGINDTL